MWDINDIIEEYVPVSDKCRRGVAGGVAYAIAREINGVSDEKITMHVPIDDGFRWWNKTALNCDLRGIDEIRQVRCRHGKKTTDHCSVVECPKRIKTIF